MRKYQQIDVYIYQCADLKIYNRMEDFISLEWVYWMFVQMFQTDIWGLGCCIYEVMTFRRAFKGKALWTIIREIKRGKVGIQIVGWAFFSAIVSIGLSFSKHSACILNFLTLSSLVTTFVVC